jgi:lysophospholipase L1-like esterase
MNFFPLALLLLTAATMQAQVLHLTCGGNLKAGTHFRADTPGFDLSSAPTSFRGNTCSSDHPFFLSASLPDGTYRVSVALGGASASVTTIRGESRRLFLLERRVGAGQTATESFIIHIRTPTIAGADVAEGQVKLKPREIGALDWDTKLTLEFNGEYPAFHSVTITPEPYAPVLYLAGDSTVVDQDKEPWAAWGQMLPLFFSSRLAIANEAESGETIRSFVSERRYDKILSTIKAGDLLMVQFAHNDQKSGAGFVTIPDYKAILHRYIRDARMHGATPILVTSMNRRSFDAAGHIKATLGEYPEATRQVAAEQHVALIDLNAMSKTLYEALGEQGTLAAFVHYPANTFPNQPEELKDDTHFNAYGAYELARAIVQSIEDQKLPLAAYLRPHLPAFNPSHPDPVAGFHLPASPNVSLETPYGR